MTERDVFFLAQISGRLAEIEVYIKLLACPDKCRSVKGRLDRTMKVLAEREKTLAKTVPLDLSLAQKTE